MKNKSLLKSYALALYAVGKEKNQVEDYLGELDFLCELFKREPEFVKFLSSPMVTKEEKDKVLEKDIKGNISLSVYAFLQVLIHRKAVAFLPSIREEYQHHYNREHGILEGRIYTPFVLDKKTIDAVTERFSERYQKKVVFRVILDQRVIAGMRIYIDDTLYDYSLDTKLNQVRDALLIEKK